MEIFDFIFHIDKYLADLIAFFGPWTYVILFAVIFCETGLVVTPFLPGDSLLFAVGALCGGGFLDVWIVYICLLAAAILGDTVNYWIGHSVGPKAFSNRNSRIFRPEYLEKTHDFYKKYGGKTIVIARFVPIVRTFAPFVAGVGKMKYSSFIHYNALGAFIWVTSLVFIGYFFGGTTFVKQNFEYMIFAIIIVSLVPMVIELIKHKRSCAQVPATGVLIEDVERLFDKEHLSE